MLRSSRSAINADVSGGLSKEEKALGFMRENLTVHKSDNWRLTNDSRIPHSKELDLLIAIKREKNQRQSVEAEDWIPLYLQVVNGHGFNFDDSKHVAFYINHVDIDFLEERLDCLPHQIVSKLSRRQDDTLYGFDDDSSEEGVIVKAVSIKKRKTNDFLEDSTDEDGVTLGGEGETVGAGDEKMMEESTDEDGVTLGGEGETVGAGDEKMDVDKGEDLVSEKPAYERKELMSIKAGKFALAVIDWAMEFPSTFGKVNNPSSVEETLSLVASVLERYESLGKDVDKQVRNYKIQKVDPIGTECVKLIDEMKFHFMKATAIRALMVCDKNKWGWTNAGWGADWLCVYDDMGRKLLLGGVKVGYLSQGPCLTEVKYVAYYGSRGQVHMDATVHTLRTNDYARTIQRIRYDFNTRVNFKDEHSSTSHGSCFYRVGGCAGWEGWYCKKVALGNGDGMLKNIEVPEKLQVGEFFVSRMKMTGPAPWWIAFPESGFKSDQKGLGIAWKCLIIRSFKSEIDGVIRLAPKITLYARQGHEDGTFYVDALISTNGDIFALSEGDNITFDVEFVTFPYTAESYYGDNAAFLKHLQECPKSWKTSLREATENKIVAHVDGGDVISTYPLIISITASIVKLEIIRGVGALPVRFENLISKRYELVDDLQPGTTIQWYETSFRPESKTYQMAFNLLLDDQDKSSWTFLMQDVISGTV